MRAAMLVATLWLLSGCLAPPPSKAPPAETTPEPAPGVRTGPAWVKEGIVMAGNWEPLTFIRRRGGYPIEDAEQWHAERTEEAARKLKEAGVNLVITSFYKGFGLQTEAADIEATRRFVGFAHRHGLRVGGYIGASMMYETFFLEEPNARDWMQVDENGAPIYYNPAQTFRYMACRNSPGYHAFIQRLLRIGIRDLRLDLIHFDQMEGWSEPHACRCGYCAEEFRRYLRRQYQPEELIARFGFSRLDGVIPPPLGVAHGPGGMVTVSNPLMQDWARFRSWTYARRYREYGAAIQALNPAVALEGNPNLNFEANRGFRYGVDVEQMLPHGDIVWSEEPNDAQWTEDGRLLSKIRSFKAARTMGKSIFVYTGGRYGAQEPESPPELRLAEAMAYNDANLGMVGDVHPEGIRLTPAARRYIDFFHQRRADLVGAAPVADVAVLRSFASVEFNPNEVLPATVLAEQALIQNRIPFTLIFDGHLADLSRYKVLVLANQDALSDAQVGQIRRWVEQGGGLVATGQTSLYTESRIRRRQPGLADVLGVNGSAPPPGRRPFGEGRVAYLPEIIPSVPPPQHPAVSYRFPNQYWKPAKNEREFVEAVRWAAGGMLSAEVTAPAWVTMELARQASTGDLLLHLVNFRVARPVDNIAAAVRIPQGWRVRQVEMASPDGGASATLSAKLEAGQARFRVPRLQVYALVVLRLERESAPASPGA